jgi:hypothetical protein
VYQGSHNFSAAAWGTPRRRVDDATRHAAAPCHCRQVLACLNYELGLVFRARPGGDYPGRTPPFLRVKRPARPYKNPIQNGFS